MYNHVVGRAASFVSPVYYILLGLDPVLGGEKRENVEESKFNQYVFKMEKKSKKEYSRKIFGFVSSSNPLYFHIFYANSYMHIIFEDITGLQIKMC